MFFVSLSVYFCTLSVYWFIHLSTSFDTHHAIPILFPEYLALSHVSLHQNPLTSTWSLVSRTQLSTVYFYSIRIKSRF